MHSHRLFIFGALSVGTVLLTGCGGGGSGGSKGPSGGGFVAGAGSEPTAGSWKTLVSGSGEGISTVAPPVGTLSERNELNEIRALQNARTTAQIEAIGYWNAGASVRWNEIARDMVISHRTPPPPASRVFAYLSVAQYDALIAAFGQKYRFQRRTPAQADKNIAALVTVAGDPSYPSDHAAVAGASAEILKFLYPDAGAIFDAKAREEEDSRVLAGANFRSDLEASDKIGRAVAQKIIARAQNDGASNAASGPSQPSGEGKWMGTNPLLPGWGRVKPWLLSAGDQYRRAAPPAFGSPEFNEALSEVRRVSDTRTPEQLRIADFWADSAGTSTPPGHWNLIAVELIQNHKLSEIRAARTLALLNMAQMDAGICCWDAKFTYWLARPSQLDFAITTPFGLPNFPSFTSGHASFSGAAASTLGYIFSDQSASLQAMAEEAAVSRLYGGIHFRFDSEIGLQNGRGIGALAIARGQSDGSPVISARSAAMSVAALKALTPAKARHSSGIGDSANWD